MPERAGVLTERIGLMPARYLTDLADVLRAAGLTVIEVDGWKTRARSSGGFAAGRPTHLMVHHTASPQRTDGQRDVDYIVAGSPDKPITNIYTDRKGVVWVCAAGATNTNGKGVDTWGGGVPADAMNLYAIAIEIANTGVGEPYPAEQQQSVLTSSAAICKHYGIPTHHVRAHFEWAPTRKIDPSGPSMWAASGKWAMDEFREDVAATIAQHPQPLPQGDADMILVKVNRGGGAWTGLSYTGAHLAHVTTPAAWSIPVDGGAPVVEVDDGQIVDDLIKSAATTTACPPEWVNTPRGAVWTAQRG